MPDTDEIDDLMLRWSQTVYGIAHALNIAGAAKLGNLDTIVDSLRAATGWTVSDLGFESCVESREFGDGDVKLDGRQHSRVFELLCSNVAQHLFVNCVFRVTWTPVSPACGHSRSVPRSVAT